MPIRDYHAELVLTPAPNGTDVVWRGGFTERIPFTGPVFRLAVRGLLWILLRRLIFFQPEESEIQPLIPLDQDLK